MKLYVRKPGSPNTKIYINSNAITRAQLAHQIGNHYFRIGIHSFSVNDVIAESESNNTAVAATIGGVVGTIGGPIGMVIGGVLGGLIGNVSDNQETSKVNAFNFSHA